VRKGSGGGDVGTVVEREALAYAISRGAVLASFSSHGWLAVHPPIGRRRIWLGWVGMHAMIGARTCVRIGVGH
jgi:hypothetical protein